MLWVHVFSVQIRIFRPMTKNGVIKHSQTQFDVVIEDKRIGEPFRVLENALLSYVKMVLVKTGELLDVRTVMIFEYMPHERIHKYQRIR